MGLERVEISVRGNGCARGRARRALLIGLASLVVLAGCPAGQVEAPPASDMDNLRSIARVYAIAHRDLGRPPQSVEDLKKVLAPVMEDPSTVFRSQRDGAEFVIVWGLDLLGQDFNSPTPLAYERKGAGGKRLVVNCRSEVSELTGEEFARLKFPRGHTPPSG